MDILLIAEIVIFGLMLGCIVGMTSIGTGLIGTPGLMLLGVAHPVGTIAVSGVFMMLTSAIKHYKNRNVHVRTALIFSITAVPLAFVFSRYACSINSVIRIKYVIASAIILSVSTLSYKFFIKKEKDTPAEFKEPGIIFPLILGSILSFFIGVTGISGSLIVISFMMIFKMPERLAIGTTNSVAIFGLMAAAAGYISTGQVNWIAVAGFIPAVMVGAYIGAHFANIIPKKPLQVIILSLLLIAAVGIIFIKKDKPECDDSPKSTAPAITADQL